MADVKILGKVFNGVSKLHVQNASGGGTTEFSAGGGGGNFIPGPIRGDATIFKEYKYNKLIVADEGKTLPAFTTSSTLMLDTTELETITNVDREYNYFVSFRGLASPVYNDNIPVAGRFCYSADVLCSEILDLLPADIVDFNNNSVTKSPFYKVAPSEGYLTGYYQGSSAVFGVIYASTYYGAYVKFEDVTANVPTGSTAGTIVVKSPKLYLGGHNTYFISGEYAKMTDVRYQYIIRIYKVLKSKTPTGYEFSSLYYNIMTDIKNNSGILQ